MRGFDRSLDCVEIILVGLVSSSSVLTQNLSARCSGSFLTLSFFVLPHIGDRHVFYLLLVRFCTFSVQTQPHYCVLVKRLDSSCSIITSLAPRCNIRTRYSRVLPCFIVLALRPLLRWTLELHLGGGVAEISGDSLNFSCNSQVAFLGHMLQS